MGWAENLQDASFRGVRFDVLSTREQVSRDHAVYEYPNVDGGDVRDLGRKARPFMLTAFLWGHTYEYQLQQLVAALDTPGDGELIHPIYGSVPSVIVTGYSIGHEADNIDSCTVEMNFLENRLGTALFSKPLPELFGQALFDRLDELTREVADFFASLTAYLNTVNSLVKQIKTIESTMINTLLTFKSDVLYTAEQLAGLADDPAAFIYELSEVLTIHTANVASAIPSLTLAESSTTRGLAPAPVEAASATTVISSWGEIVADMEELVALPEALVSGSVTPAVSMPVNASPDDVQDVRAAYSVLAAAELASAACSLLTDDDQANAMTPVDVDRLVSDVRTQIQFSLDVLRARYEPQRPLVTTTSSPGAISWLAQADLLRTVALDVQTLGLLVLSRRPPLTRKTLDHDSSLRLLAHQWYGDHNRAPELQRLNPDIRDPNTLIKGMVLNAYSR